jgi:hypothetical protein
MNEKLVGTAVRENAASKTVARLTDLTSRANELADRTNGRLVSVTRQSSPAIRDDAKKGDEWRPPLFAEMWSYLDTLETALNSIDDTLNRLEI